MPKQIPTFGVVGAYFWSGRAEAHQRKVPVDEGGLHGRDMPFEPTWN